VSELLFILISIVLARATYEIAQVIPESRGGTQTSVCAATSASCVGSPGLWTVIPNLKATLTLTNANNSVSCRWSIPAQTDTAGGAIMVVPMRGGVPLDVAQPMYSVDGTMIATFSGTFDDRPGYIGPIDYVLAIQPIVGTGHAPANFGGSGSIGPCNEIVQP
jgi:hypothetical protein